VCSKVEASAWMDSSWRFPITLELELSNIKIKNELFKEAEETKNKGNIILSENVALLAHIMGMQLFTKDCVIRSKPTVDFG
jgi:hypothetical protein